MGHSCPVFLSNPHVFKMENRSVTSSNVVRILFLTGLIAIALFLMQHARMKEIDRRKGFLSYVKKIRMDGLEQVVVRRSGRSWVIHDESGLNAFKSLLDSAVVLENTGKLR
jgi:hypothetical protein